MEICTTTVRGEAQEASDFASIRGSLHHQFNSAARPSASYKIEDLEAGPSACSDVQKTSETRRNAENEAISGVNSDGFKNSDVETDGNSAGLAAKLLGERLENTQDKAEKSSGKVGRPVMPFITSPAYMSSINSLLSSLNDIRARQATLVESVQEQLKKGQNDQVQANQENLDPKNLSPKAMLAAAKARLATSLQNRASFLDDEDQEDQEEVEDAEEELEQLEDDQEDLEQPCEDAESTDSLDSSEDILPSKGDLNSKVAHMTQYPVDITDVIDFNKEGGFNFGNIFPGQVLEDNLELRNCSKQPIVLKISAVCHNSEFDALEEYVFSMRKNTAMEYNDQYYIMLSPGTSLSMKIAVKAPLNRENKGGFFLGGDVIVAFKDRPESQKVFRIDAKVQMPKISLTRELQIAPIQFPVLKLAYKRGKKAEFKIPVKNFSNFSVQVEYELLHDQAPGDCSAEILDCFAFPLSATLPANGTSLLTLMIKPVSIAAGAERQNIKKMLLAKVKNSSLIFQFVLWIETYG